MSGGPGADSEGERPQERPPARAARSEELEFIQSRKAGRLLTVSVVLGGLLAQANDDEIAALRRYGDATGHAFQIVDDLLDIEESAATLGKTAGKDLAQGKLTYPALFGAEAARAKAQELLQVALANADIMRGPVNYLAAMAPFISERRS